MKIYGYQEHADVLLTLSEVSFQATPGEIRCLAQFLHHAADSMEQTGDAFGHEHLRDFCRRSGVESVTGTADVIVARAQT